MTVKGNTVELDDLKVAFNKLDAKMERQTEIQTSFFQQMAHGRIHRTLSPLSRSMTWTIIFGAALAFLGVMAWRGDMARGGGVFISGIVLHVFGILTIISAAVTKVRVAALDVAGPVYETQVKLAALRRTYIAAGLVAGLSWAVLWVPFTVAVLGLMFHVDMTAQNGGLVLAMIAGSALCVVLVMGAMQLWSAATGRAKDGASITDMFVSKSLRKAQAEVNDLAAFSRS